MPLAVPTTRPLWRAAVAWFAALVLLVPGTAGAKTMLRRSFDPAPPRTFYASVWAGVESTITLEFGERLRTDRASRDGVRRERRT